MQTCGIARCDQGLSNAATDIDICISTGMQKFTKQALIAGHKRRLFLTVLDQHNYSTPDE